MFFFSLNIFLFLSRRGGGGAGQSKKCHGAGCTGPADLELW